MLRGVDVFEPDLDVLVRWGANVAPLTLDGEPWRLFTSMFLHSGVVHLLANMYMLALCGRLLERSTGSLTFVVIYLLSGLFGSLLSAWWAAHHMVTVQTLVAGMFVETERLALVVSVGASGALMGIAGAYAAWRGIRGPDSADVAAAKPQFVVLQIIGINLLMGMVTPGVDQACHIGGLLAGSILGAGFALVDDDASPGWRQLARVGLVALAVLLLAGVLSRPPTDELQALRTGLVRELQQSDAASAQTLEAPSPSTAERAAAAERARLPPPVDAATASGIAIDLGDNPESMALSRDGRRLYVTSNGSNSLRVVDLQTRQVVRTVSGGDFATGLDGCPDNVCAGRGAMDVALSPDERFAYVASMREDAVAVVDLAAGKVIASMAVGRFPRTLAISADGKRGYVLNSVDNSVSFLDLASHVAVGAPLALPGGDASHQPFGRVVAMWLSADGRELWVENSAAGRFERIDTATRAITAALPLPDGLLGSAWHAPTGTLYVRGSKQLLIQSPAARALTALPWCAPLQSFDIAVSPDNKRLAIADKNRLVHLVSLETRSTIGLYPTGDWPSGLLFSADGKRLFVANAGHTTVSILDLSRSLAIDPSTTPPLICNVENF